MSRELMRALVAEAIGTFALVSAGCGAIMVDASTHQLGHVGVALTFGLVIMFGIYAVGHISGVHFNGAVTFAFALTRHFPWQRALAYCFAQLTGALAAAALLRASLGDVAQHGLWVYVLAPVVGTSLGGLAYQFVRGEHPQPAELHADAQPVEEAA